MNQKRSIIETIPFKTPVYDGINALELDVYYRKGGINHYEGVSFSSQFTLSITPIEMLHGVGSRRIGFSGINVPLKTCNRFSSKKLNKIARAVFLEKDNIFRKFCKMIIGFPPIASKEYNVALQAFGREVREMFKFDDFEQEEA